jgi:hypothetical protein
MLSFVAEALVASSLGAHQPSSAGEKALFISDDDAKNLQDHEIDQHHSSPFRSRYDRHHSWRALSFGRCVMNDLCADACALDHNVFKHTQPLQSRCRRLVSILIADSFICFPGCLVRDCVAGSF